MKKHILLTLLFCVASFSFSQTRAERKQAKKLKLEANFKIVKALVGSENFKFEADWAIPIDNDIANIGLSLPGGGAVFQGGRVNLATNKNYIYVENNTANLFLPYFGRVFFPTRNLSDNSFTYDGELNDYSVSINEKKKRITIKFEANKNNDCLKFYFLVSAGGNTRLTVNSSKRQTITYVGKIAAITPENKS